jgi:hypothetical protein
VGEFIGRLDNGGERITVVGAQGTQLIDFTYDDDAPWPRQADGSGPSLELINPANTSRSEQGNAAYWRSSALVGGSPGEGSAGGGPDFDGSGVVDSDDINLLYQALRSADPDPRFDLTGDGRGDHRDRDALIHDVLRTRFGDANLDLRFDSSDLVRVFQAGEYEDATAGNSTWEEGDWNADGDFNTADLVLAFQDGGYAAAASHRSPIDRDILARDLIFQDTVRQFARNTPLR